MARQKKAEESGAGSPWMNTFADLMNLLLCFFVLLFAFSTVDADKYEQIVQSMSARGFNIFNGGDSVTKDGHMIANGMKQLTNLNEYSNNMEENTESKEGSKNSAEIESYESMDTSTAEKKVLEKKKEASQEMYDNLSDLADENNLSEFLELSIDPNFQYVKISLSGSILFDSGKADVKSDALPILSKVGDILTVYKGYQIELEGHTDNIPIHNSSYKSNNWLSSARALNAAMYLVNEKGISPKTLSWTGRGEYDPVSSNTTEEGRAKNRRVEIKIFNR